MDEHRSAIDIDDLAEEPNGLLEGWRAVDDWRDDRIGAAERGANPTVLARMRTGWAVIGDTQHLPGYCLLLYAGHANHLTDLPRPERQEFLLDLSIMGEAVTTVCRSRDPEFLRANYEILGNSWPHLHGHVHARYNWEPDEYRNGPVWRYGEHRLHPQHQLAPHHDSLKNALITELQRITATAYSART